MNNPKQAGKKEFESHCYDLIRIMEAQQLTGVEFGFRDGWKIKINHPARQRVLDKGGNPYSE